MLIQRYQMLWIDKLLQPGKVLLIYGARQVGKTTLMQTWYDAQTDKKSILRVDAADFSIRQRLTDPTPQSLFQLVGMHKIIIIDSAQVVPDLSLTLKKLLNEMPFIKIIALGSSVFDVTEVNGDPLAGRKNYLFLHPMAQMELKEIESFSRTADYLPNRLLYGTYPDVLALSTFPQKEEYLREVVSNYIFKDILAYEGLRKADKILELLKLLAWQIGKEVSLPELGSALGLNKMTVECYLELLQKFFIIYPRTGFSRNPRKEISKSKRWYFFDNGILNTVIADFRSVDMRPDIDALWENYLLSERQKLHHCLRQDVSSWFWKSYNRQELDLMEVRGVNLAGFNLCWKATNVKAPSSWLTFYPEATYQIIDQNNYLDWITNKT